MSALAYKFKIQDMTKFVNLHRVLGKKGYQYGIENHISLIIDQHPTTNKRAILTSKYGMDWTNCTENDIFSIDMESKLPIDTTMKDTRYDELLLLNMLSIHAGVAMNRKDIKCIIHTHPLSICTLMGLEQPFNRILNVHQNNARFNAVCKIGYDDEFVTNEKHQYDKYTKLMGKDNDILFLTNHGVVVTADCVETAWDRFYFLDLAAQIQVNIYNTQKEIRYIPQNGVDMIAKEWGKEGERRTSKFHFDAVVESIDS